MCEKSLHNSLCEGILIYQAMLNVNELTGCDFSDSSLIDVDMRGAILKAATLTNISFDSVLLSYAKLPLSEKKWIDRNEGNFEQVFKEVEYI